MNLLELFLSLRSQKQNVKSDASLERNTGKWVTVTMMSEYLRSSDFEIIAGWIKKENVPSIKLVEK